MLPKVENRMSQIVLVTGASGYVALHCVKQLLLEGYSVRGTVRNLNNVKKVSAKSIWENFREISPLLRLPFAQERLHIVEADLLKAEDWDRVTLGCSFILHIASPWPIVADESTIRTAVEGTLNVLTAASHHPEVRKVVLTSSCAAVNGINGHKNNSRVFDETCWTDMKSPTVDNYAKSKTLAEQEAWKFWHGITGGISVLYILRFFIFSYFQFLESKHKFDLIVLNPTFITGPVLSNVENGSATIIGRMMDFRTYLAAPKASLGVVDVRDVARAHVDVLTNDEANGERILITSQPSIWFRDMTKWLAKEFRKQGYLLSYLQLNNTAYFFAFNTNIGISLRILGIQYTDPRKSIIDMMYSMIEHGMVGNGITRLSSLIDVLLIHKSTNSTCTIFLTVISTSLNKTLTEVKRLINERESGKPESWACLIAIIMILMKELIPPCRQTPVLENTTRRQTHDFTTSVATACNLAIIITFRVLLDTEDEINEPIIQGELRDHITFSLGIFTMTFFFGCWCCFCCGCMLCKWILDCPQICGSVITNASLKLISSHPSIRRKLSVPGKTFVQKSYMAKLPEVKHIAIGVPLSKPTFSGFAL
uniref:Epimerase domain-containing protein n=1 Tax=Heterorhabditis bacteriophora TaxID=37862 RepID=A0A1I7XCR9_HETBA